VEGFGGAPPVTRYILPTYDPVSPKCGSLYTTGEFSLVSPGMLIGSSEIITRGGGVEGALIQHPQRGIAGSVNGIEHYRLGTRSRLPVVATGVYNRIRERKNPVSSGRANGCSVSIEGGINGGPT